AAVMPGTVPGGGGAKVLSVPWIVIAAGSVSAWKVRARLTLVQTATTLTAKTASPSALMATYGPRSRMCFPFARCRTTGQVDPNRLRCPRRRGSRGAVGGSTVHAADRVRRAKVLVTSRVVGYDQARLDQDQFNCFQLAGFEAQGVPATLR